MNTESGRGTPVAGRWPTLICAALVFLASGPSAPDAVARDAATQVLAIHSGDTVHELTVEAAATPEERGRGLMFRRTMADDHGMLFDFGTPQAITMWMRNTPLSLDMVFADGDGVIRHIARRTTPLSDRTISSRSQARYVLEINGGKARALGLKIGDRLAGPLIE